MRENDIKNSKKIIEKLRKELNLFGEQKLKYEIRKIEEENDREKDSHFEKYIMEPYK